MNQSRLTSPKTLASRETWCLGLLFIFALGYSVYGVTYHWTMGYLVGHEFRQTQTAIISYYIDKDDNFSLLYETPILGKPWVSNLLEVPVYEWAVVWLSRATGWSHHVAARTLSASCFYLTLPAIWLLLGRLGLTRPRRLLPLALIVSAPVYIFYSRAFLMDSLAWLASVWWLVAFVRTMDSRRWPWLVLAIVAGTLAVLVKSAMFAVWMIPGAAYGAWLLWCDLRSWSGWRRPLATALWGLATVAIALGLLRWWVAYTDPIKEAHPSAWIFASKALAQGNWGLLDFKAICSTEVWGFWLKCWEQSMMSRWVIGGGLLLGFALPAIRGRVLILGALFFAAQFLFPFAYAHQDYYYYSCAVFLLAALGYVLLGVWDSRVPRWLAVLILLAPFAAQVDAYRRDYYQEQSIVFDGDRPFTTVLRELTPVNSVLVEAGSDWAAPTPYYAQRKALLVRNGLEFDKPYLRRAFQDLADENVSALVVHGKLRTNADFINLAAARFDLVESKPTFSWANVDVYVARSCAAAVRAGLRDKVRYPEIIVHAAVDEDARQKSKPVTPAIGRNELKGIVPIPYQMRFLFGEAARQGRESDSVILAHASADIWLEPPRDATRIEWIYGIIPEAYQRDGDRTDGVDFSIWGELPDGSERRIYRRLLDPGQNSEDRGDQHVVVAYTPRPGETLRFSTRPGGSAAFDWSYWVKIEVK